MRHFTLPLWAVLAMIAVTALLSLSAKAEHIQELVLGQDVPVIFVCQTPQPMIDAAAALPTSKEDADTFLQAGVDAGVCIWLQADDVGKLEKVLDTGVDVDGSTFHVVIVRSPYNQRGFYTILWVGDHYEPPAQNQEDS